MGAKIYVDGIIMNDTIAYLNRKVPFEMEYKYGDLTISPEKLKDVLTDYDRNGIQTMMHCIGNKAIRVALDAVEAARKANGDSGIHHCIAHANYVSPEDVKRFAELGVYPNIQTWLSTDSEFGVPISAVIGEKGWKTWHGYKTLLKAGACINIGSDWPCGPSNPYPGLYMASTRIDPMHPELGVFNEKERLTVEELIEASTLNGAKLMHMDDVSGSIEEGKLADLVVLDRNILECEPEELIQTRVLTTVMEGRPIYHADDSPMIPHTENFKTQEMWR